MEKEKGIDRDDMISAISGAIASAAQKGVGSAQEVRVEINPKTGALKAWNALNVVDSVGDSASEIHIEKARQLSPEAEIGGVIEKEIDPAFLGRIAAQTARQAIMQRIRQFGMLANVAAGGAPELRALSYEPLYFNFEAEREVALASEEVVEVTVLDQVKTGGAVLDASFPSADEMAAFDTDLRPQPNVGNFETIKMPDASGDGRFSSSMQSMAPLIVGAMLAGENSIKTRQCLMHASSKVLAKQAHEGGGQVFQQVTQKPRQCNDVYQIILHFATFVTYVNGMKRT